MIVQGRPPASELGASINSAGFGVGLAAETSGDIVFDDFLEFLRNAFAAKGHRLLAVDENRSGGRFARARQGDPDIGVFRFAGPVDDAAHDGDVQSLGARIDFFPCRHFVADQRLDVARQLLENG